MIRVALWQLSRTEEKSLLFTYSFAQGKYFQSLVMTPTFNSNQTVCPFSTPHPRSTSFRKVSNLTQAGELSDVFMARNNPCLHFTLYTEIPDLNCFSGDNTVSFIVFIPVLLSYIVNINDFEMVFKFPEGL